MAPPPGIPSRADPWPGSFTIADSSRRRSPLEEALRWTALAHDAPHGKQWIDARRQFLNAANRAAVNHTRQDAAA